MARNFFNKCICTLCSVSIIFVSPVHASALPYLGAITAAAEAGNTVGELFGNVLEDFFGLQHQCTLTEATLITINRSLDAIFSNSYGYDIVNPYSGSSGTYHRTNATFGDMLADMNNSIATLGTRYLSTLVSNSNGISSVVTDIKTNTQNSAAADLAALTFLGSIEDYVGEINYDNSVNGTFVDSSFNEVNNNTTVFPSDTYYFRFSLTRYTSTSLYKFVVPCTPYGRTRSDNYDIYFYQLYNNNLLPIGVNFLYTFTNSGNAIEIYVNDIYYHLSSIFVQIVPKTNNDQYYVTVTNPIVCYGMSSENPDYYPLTQYMFNKLNYDQMNELLEKDFTAQIDGSTIEIDNSINVTPIELDVSIGVQDFTAVNTVSNKLRTWLSTGVGVVDLIAALDQLDDTFFTLHNRSVIETISTGYTDYYD